jgi:hypothetical protein
VKLSALAASTGVATLVVLSLGLGVAAPAQAITIGDADELWRYVQTVKSSQLAALQATYADTTPWRLNQSRMLASNAPGYTVQHVMGNAGADAVSEVIPIKNAGIDPKPGAKMKIGIGGKGITLPAFRPKEFIKSAVGGGPMLALTAFLFRADIANGLLSFKSIDANGAVCGAPDNNEFINIITGQDCAAWKMNEEYEANSDVVIGVRGGWSCGTPVGFPKEVCYRLTGAVAYVRDGTDSMRYTFDYTIGGVASGGLSSPEYRNQQGAWQYANAEAQQLYWQLVDSSRGKGEMISFWNGNGHSDRLTEYRATPTSPPAVATQSDPDPERQFECRVYQVSGPVLTGYSEPFRESTREMATPNCPATTDGSTPRLVEVYEVGDGMSELVWHEEPTEAHIAYEQEFGELCKIQTCLLDLVQLSSGTSCFGLKNACDGWMTSPTRDADYGCTYGGRAQPIQECHVYANIFNEQKRLAGNAWADPATGNDVGGGTSLRYDEALMGLPGRSPTALRDCGGTGWGEPNPLQWVLKPIQCALEWAWIPSPVKVGLEMEKVKQAWEETFPGKFSTMVGSWSVHPSVGGCSKDVVLMGTPIKLANACPGGMLEGLAVTSRYATSLGMTIIVVLAVKRAVGGTVGYQGLE